MEYMMKSIVYTLILVTVFAANDVLAQHHAGIMKINSKEKNPAVAALLSIQPLPFALGNFYAGNWERGIIYSTVELALFIPAAVLLGRNGWGMGMHSYSYYGYSVDRRWTSSERTQFNFLLASYILVKILSAFDAGYSAETFNDNLSMMYDIKINSTILSLNIPIR
jgi:hypothetical protein